MDMNHDSSQESIGTNECSISSSNNTGLQLACTTDGTQKYKNKKRIRSNADGYNYK